MPTLPNVSPFVRHAVISCIIALGAVLLTGLLAVQPVTAQSAFITTWETTSSSESITIPTDDQTGVSYDFTIDWGDGSATENYTGSNPDPTHTHTSSGTYSVDVTGSFPNLFWTDAATRRGSRRPSSGETSRGKV